MEPVGVEPTSKQPFQSTLLRTATFNYSTLGKRTNPKAISLI